MALALYLVSKFKKINKKNKTVTCIIHVLLAAEGGSIEPVEPPRYGPGLRAGAVAAVERCCCCNAGRCVLLFGCCYCCELLHSVVIIPHHSFVALSSINCKQLFLLNKCSYAWGSLWTPHAKIFAVLVEWYHHIVLTMSFKLVSFYIYICCVTFSYYIQTEL